MPDPYLEALLTVGERVMTFGGFQRTPRGEFWISREDVLRAIDEELEKAKRAAEARPLPQEPT